MKAAREMYLVDSCLSVSVLEKSYPFNSQTKNKIKIKNTRMWVYIVE